MSNIDILYKRLNIVANTIVLKEIRKDKIVQLNNLSSKLGSALDNYLLDNKIDNMMVDSVELREERLSDELVIIKVDFNLRKIKIRKKV